MDPNDNNSNNKKSLKDIINNLEKKIDRIEKGEIEVSKVILTPEEQEIQDRTRYQSYKKDYYQHDTDGQKCSISQCVIECDYFPEDGIQTEEGEIYYDDPNLSAEFYGTPNALRTRKKVAAMSPKELEQYKNNLDIIYEYDEETRKAIAAGKRLYVRSGSYPTHDLPPAGAQYYEYVNGDKRK